MEAKTSRKASFGDSLDIAVTYTNISNSAITFYPKNLIQIWNPKRIHFDGSSGKILNLYRDFTAFVVIQPGERHLTHHIIKVSPSLFYEGLVDLRISYSANCEIEVGNKLYGNLQSNTFQVRVHGNLYR